MNNGVNSQPSNHINMKKIQDQAYSYEFSLNNPNSSQILLSNNYDYKQTKILNNSMNLYQQYENLLQDFNEKDLMEQQLYKLSLEELSEVPQTLDPKNIKFQYFYVKKSELKDIVQIVLKKRKAEEINEFTYQSVEKDSYSTNRYIINKQLYIGYQYRNFSLFDPVYIIIEVLGLVYQENEEEPPKIETIAWTMQEIFDQFGKITMTQVQFPLYTPDQKFFKLLDFSLNRYPNIRLYGQFYKDENNKQLQSYQSNMKPYYKIPSFHLDKPWDDNYEPVQFDKEIKYFKENNSKKGKRYQNSQDQDFINFIDEIEQKRLQEKQNNLKNFQNNVQRNNQQDIYQRPNNNIYNQFLNDQQYDEYKNDNNVNNNNRIQNLNNNANVNQDENNINIEYGEDQFMGLHSWPQEYDKQFLNRLKKRKTEISYQNQELYVTFNKIQINNLKNSKVYPDMFTIQIQLLRKVSDRLFQIFQKNNHKEMLQSQGFLKLDIKSPQQIKQNFQWFSIKKEARTYQFDIDQDFIKANFNLEEACNFFLEITLLINENNNIQRKVVNYGIFDQSQKLEKVKNDFNLYISKNYILNMNIGWRVPQNSELSVKLMFVNPINDNLKTQNLIINIQIEQNNKLYKKMKFKSQILEYQKIENNNIQEKNELELQKQEFLNNSYQIHQLAIFEGFNWEMDLESKKQMSAVFQICNQNEKIIFQFRYFLFDLNGQLKQGIFDEFIDSEQKMVLYGKINTKGYGKTYKQKCLQVFVINNTDEEQEISIYLYDKLQQQIVLNQIQVHRVGASMMQIFQFELEFFELRKLYRNNYNDIVVCVYNQKFIRRMIRENNQNLKEQKKNKKAIEQQKNYTYIFKYSKIHEQSLKMFNDSIKVSFQLGNYQDILEQNQNLEQRKSEFNKQFSQFFSQDTIIQVKFILLKNFKQKSLKIKNLKIECYLASGQNAIFEKKQVNVEYEIIEQEQNLENFLILDGKSVKFSDLEYNKYGLETFLVVQITDVEKNKQICQFYKKLIQIEEKKNNQIDLNYDFIQQGDKSHKPTKKKLNESDNSDSQDKINVDNKNYLIFQGKEELQGYKPPFTSLKLNYENSLKKTKLIQQYSLILEVILF